jgi:hypothetical protein
MENEGEFKKFIQDNLDVIPLSLRIALEERIQEATKEYPKVSQKWVPVKGRRVDWKSLCKLMELRIIEFENFGKKWFGDNPNE